MVRQLRGLPWHSATTGLEHHVYYSSINKKHQLKYRENNKYIPELVKISRKLNLGAL